MKVQSLVRRIACGHVSIALVLLCEWVLRASAVSAPGVGPAKKTSRATAHDLRVMTFNLRVRTVLDGHNIWDNRRDLVAERVRAFDADLLGTQEGLASMEADLQQRLRDYTFRGVGRSDGKQRGEMCGVFFKTARFALLDGGYFWLSKTPEKPGSRGWAEVYPRMVTWVKLQPRAGGAAFYWFNTHFDAFSPVGPRKIGGAAARSDQRTLPAACPAWSPATSIRPPARSPTTRCSLRSRPQSLRSTMFFAPRIRSPTRDEGTVHFFTGHTSGQHIDWILATGHFRTINAEIDHTRGPNGYPSDHFPVIATLHAP